MQHGSCDRYGRLGLVGGGGASAGIVNLPYHIRMGIFTSKYPQHKLVFCSNASNELFNKKRLFHEIFNPLYDESDCKIIGAK